MAKTLVILLLALCVVTSAHAQFRFPGAVDADWLTDDPQKADRLPVWRLLLGNQRFRATTPRQSPVSVARRWNYSTRNTGNSWTRALQNAYMATLWRQMLANQNNLSRAKLPSRAKSTVPPRATTHAPTRVTNGGTSGRKGGNGRRDRLQNLLQIMLLNTLLGNQSGQKSTAS